MHRTPTAKQTSADIGSHAGNLRQFLAWVDAQPRTYAQTMEAWRTSCPRLSAWEDATAGGLVDVVCEEGTARADAAVRLTGKGAALLGARQRSAH
jgi:hypothetical protein